MIACGVTITAALIAGLTPSIQLSRPTAVLALEEGRTGSRRGVRGMLVVAEVAAALVLAVGAGFSRPRSFVLIQRVDPGFTRDDVTVLQVFSTRRLDTPEKRIVFLQQALDHMRGLPGVVAAGGVTSMPFGEARVVNRQSIAIAGRPAVSGEAALAYTTAVTGDYFQCMHVPLLEGRLFDGTDTGGSRQVALVSRRAARQFWGASDPVLIEDAIQVHGEGLRRRGRRCGGRRAP